MSIEDEFTRGMDRLFAEAFTMRSALSAGASTATTASTGPTLNTDFLLMKMRAAQAAFEGVADTMRGAVDSMHDFGRIAGIAMHELKYGLAQRAPNKAHKRRRWDRTGSYHRRIQKKWNKRFGTHPVETCYVVDNDALSLFPGQRGGKTLYATPGVLAKMREAIK